MGWSYSDEERKAIYAKVCRGIAAGMSIGRILRSDDSLPSKDTIFNWLMEDKNFSDQYARARTARADARSERIDDLTDEVKAGTLDPAAARVIIDAEKWQAGKENAKRYGDRHVVQGDDEAPPVRTSSTIDERDKRDLARWIAATLTQGANAANKDADAG